MSLAQGLDDPNLQAEDLQKMINQQNSVML